MNYIEENNKLLKFILNERFFKTWKYEWNDFSKETLFSDSCLELYLTAHCNQKCEYCYLIKNKGLYPKEYDNKEHVIKNLKIFLNWIIEENFIIPKLEIFSGEIWEYDYGFEILDILYEYLQKKLFIKWIIIPSNCSFLREEKTMQRIQNYINKFRAINCPLVFSISVDGKVIENNSRPYADHSVKDDEFYERMFMFASHNNFKFHPMVSSCNVNNWIENFKWWEKKCNDYDLDVDNEIMMLEVRNDDWTEQSIKEYNNFINFLIDRSIEKKGKKNTFEYLVQDLEQMQSEEHTYNPFIINEVDSFAGCGVSNTLHIRLGDLAICPCHRTSYDKYLYGHFCVENDKIVDIKSNNTQMAIRILFGNNNLCHLGCDSCLFNQYCLKGCFGAQLESTQDPFIPIASVCNFFEQKYLNLLNKYTEIGFFDYCNTISPYSESYLRAKKLLNFKERVFAHYGLGEN